MKKPIIMMVVMMLVGIMTCCAEPIAVNDSITSEKFMYAFNNNADAKQQGISIVGTIKKPTYNNNINRVISGYVTNNNVSIMLSSNPKTGVIYEIGILRKKPSSDNEMQAFIMVSLLVERTIGTPSGDETADGMFALLDALKKGRGVYWSNTTNRRYIVEPINVSPDMIGAHISAGI